MSFKIKNNPMPPLVVVILTSGFLLTEYFDHTSFPRINPFSGHIMKYFCICTEWVSYLPAIFLLQIGLQMVFEKNSSLN